MSTHRQNPEELLKQPLYVFDLPRELLATLATKKTSSHPAIQPDQDSPQTTDEHGEIGIATSTTCSLCQVSFNSVNEQRVHVRSDHHRYNLKARLRGNKALNELDFNQAIGELDESISGSESEPTDEEEDCHRTPDNNLVALLKRQAKLASPETDPTETSQNKRTGKQPLLWFKSPLLPPTVFLGVYRALFTDLEQDSQDQLVSSLQKKQTNSIIRNSNQDSQKAAPDQAQSKSTRHYFLCMMGGGHFAAMIASAASEINKGAGGIENRKPVIIAHKSFHRYTTRRKQGGSQSASDAAKGAAHSAGSTLRRYNEAALEKEIRDLLKDWKHMIDKSELLFVRAAGPTNRRVLFGPYDGQVLKPSDPRLRGFPFSTRRATQAELLRAYTELTRVKISHLDEATLAKEQEKHREVVSPKPAAQKQKPKISKEEEAAILHTSQIQVLIRRSKVPALLSYLANNTIPASFKFHSSASQPIHRCPTPLHLAASSSAPAIVIALLTKAGADPTILNGEERPAFDLAGDRPTRDAFRIARHEIGEASWDWEAAHVPPPISKEEVDCQADRDRRAAEKAEAQRREEALERIKQEDAKGTTQRKRAARTLAPREKTASEKREEEMRGMTPEMRMRLERERRARAAEDRMRRMQAGQGP
ncbi:C2H2 finger and ankyrin domain-containing protein [Coccidioides immitis RS]|uniref:C2H2 finger and ankyrin domain-containing protein n=2 Tax=Coccidioides immitis TaxID=5501 RepID=J3K7K3_COCIM|nr:C2H2 finger and ankyrin domain-containing protein [Coccidioides immitis RS]EAS30687.3 C2H2 finger and ankyrin domain-containing protein [Coccidioides immitis RS]